MTQRSTACTEHELVGAVRAGDDRAFEELYSRYRARISSYILGLVGDYARAEDIAQEVFISALRRLRETDQQIAFKPWIYQIAKNACIDEFRSARRAREVPLGDDEDDSPSEEARLISAAPTPDAAVESKQSLDDLRGAFHGLSESHHKLIVMREFEGLSYDQIGQQLGMTRPVVESSLFRARRRLTEEYGELVSGRRCQHVQQLIAEDERRSLLKLGVRERRQLARHLSHCQPCRREARLAGVDDSLFQAPRVIERIAALLPIPWLLRRFGRGSRDGAAGSSSGSHALASLQQPLQNLASFVETVGPSTGLGRAAAAAVAALAIAGGGVAATQLTNQSTPHRSSAATSATSASAHAGSAKPGSASAHSAAGTSRAHGFTSRSSVVSSRGHTGRIRGAGASGTSEAFGGGSGSSGAHAAGSGQSSSSTLPGGTSAPSLGSGTIPGAGVKLPAAPKIKTPKLTGSGHKSLGSVIKGANPLKNVPKVSLPGVKSTSLLPKVQLPKL